MNQHVKHPLQARVERMLKRYGGFYTFEDIIGHVLDGRMQSFALGDSWAVTQIAEYPRRTVLDIVLAVGNLPELELLVTDIEGWARERGIDCLTATGRNGWEKVMLAGWKRTSARFIKELV